MLINNIMNYIIYPSFIYFNYINKNNIVKYSFNVYFMYFLYNNRYNYLIDTVDTYFTIRNKIYKLFPKDKSFLIENVYLYTNLKEKYDVTEYFHKNNKKIDKMNKLLINNIYSYYNIDFKNDDNIRLKIYFKYNEKDYITYFSYDDHNIPYPPYSEDIINNYRNDIIFPFYTTESKKKYFYTLFNMETNDILEIKINNEENNDLLEYFNNIKTPFNDYGILYNNPVKLLWALEENNINIETFYKFYLKFESMYINEETFELYDHIIEMTNNDLNKYIISDRMKEIIDLKKKDDK